jgi:hypothetical protein
MQNDPTQASVVERPDEHEETGDELYCWMPGNDDRECSGACVAYDESYSEDQRRSSCSLINMFKSVAMSHAKMANVANQKARAAATPNQPPPEVRS